MQVVPLTDPELRDLRPRVGVPPLRRHLLHHGHGREGQRRSGGSRGLLGVRVGPIPHLLLLLLRSPGKVLLSPPVVGRVVIKGCKKEQVRQCLGFRTADFWYWFVY